MKLFAAATLLCATAATAAPLFRNPVPIDLNDGSRRLGLIARDLDDDGFRDLVVVEEDGFQTLRSRRGGPFDRALSSVRALESSGFMSAAIGDIDGDGRLDAVRADHGTVTAFRGDGSGGFASPRAIPTIANAAIAGLADLNGDGRDDLLVSGNFSEPYDNELAVQLNDGSGTFGTPRVFANGEGATAFTGIDLNGDRKLDLVVSRWNRTEIHLGAGDGTLHLHATMSAGHPALADFDRDGRIDVAVRSAQAVHVSLGRGDGTFVPEVTQKVAKSEWEWGLALAAADVDRDGDQDLVTMSGSIIGVLLNDAGRMTSISYYAGGYNALSLAAGDFDQDGDVDLATLDQPQGDALLSVIEGNGDGTFRAYRMHPEPPGKSALRSSSPVIADVDGDRRADVLGLAENTTLLGAIVNDGRGAPSRYAYSATTMSFAIGTSGSVAAGDFDRDGVTDAVVANVDAKRIVPMRGRNDGTFTALPSFSAPRDVTDGARAQLLDVTGDGSVDFVMDEWLYRGDGLGGFGEAVSIPGGMFVDVNADGRPDLVDGSYPTVRVFLNSGGGAFTESWTLHLSEFFDVAAAGDFTSDGVPDLAISTDHELLVHRGEGDGTFASPSSFRMEVDAPCSAQEIDRDGKLDLVCGATVFLGDGDGTFRSIERYRAAGGTRFGDFDGDGAGELMTMPFTVLWHTPEPEDAIPTRLALTVSADATTNVMVSAAVTTDRNLTVTNAVRWTVNGKRVALTPVVKGRSSLTLDPLPGTYSIVAEYAGDEYHAASRATTRVVLQGGRRDDRLTPRVIPRRRP